MENNQNDMKTTAINNTNKTQKSIMGFDEVGRGPLAGPVVVAAVCLKYQTIPPKDIIIRDSKKMTVNQRMIANRWIVQNTYWGIGQVSATIIDTIGINSAIVQAAHTALTQIRQKAPISMYQIIIDGKDAWFKTAKTVIKGESKHQEIAMASIIAKHYRDQIMAKLDIKYPDWKFDHHVGYATKYHRTMIKQHGLIEEIHRTTFCQKIIQSS